MVNPVAGLTPAPRDALRKSKAEIIGLLASGSLVAPVGELLAQPARPTSAVRRLRRR